MSNICIDIGNREIRIAQKGKAYYERMPKNLVNDKSVVSPESLSMFLKELKKKYSLSGKDVSLVLPETATYFRTVNIPVLSDAQIKLNLPYEFNDFIESDSNNYSYDYVIDEVVKDQNGEPKSLHLMAAAGLKSTIDEYAKILKRAGLKLKVALPYEMCVINLLKNTDSSKEVCLIGTDYDTTRIYIFKGNRLKGAKTIDIGCKDIDKAIVKKYDCDEYLAETYRLENYEDVLNDINVKNIYENISIEVMKTINFYKYENRDSELKDVYFFSTEYDNSLLKKTIIENVDFEEKDIYDLLPEQYKNSKDAPKAFMALGLM